MSRVSLLSINNLVMIRISFLILTLALVSCVQEKEKRLDASIDSKWINTFPELLGSNNFDSIGALWLNEILSDKDRRVSILLFDSLDHEFNKMTLGQRVFSSEKFNEPIGTHLHCLEICFKPDNSLYVDGTFCKNEDLDERIEAYFNFLHNGDSSAKCDPHSVFKIGDSVNPCSCISIGLDLNSNKDTSIDWARYFGIISQVIERFQEKRDEISKARYNQSFLSLESEAKKEILHSTSIRLLLTFDMEFCSDVVTPSKRNRPIRIE